MESITPPPPASPPGSSNASASNLTQDEALEFGPLRQQHHQPSSSHPTVASPWTLGSIETPPAASANSPVATSPPTSQFSTEAVLAAACSVAGFDIAEVWFRTGPKTHQLTHSHVRPTALEDSVRTQVTAVYYGAERWTHKLSPALCKRAKEVGDVVWMAGAELRSSSLNAVGTAVAVPMCHAGTLTNMTVIFFSMRRCVTLIFGRDVANNVAFTFCIYFGAPTDTLRSIRQCRIPPSPPAIEFFVHLSLAAGVASINTLLPDSNHKHNNDTGKPKERKHGSSTATNSNNTELSQSEHVAVSHPEAPSATPILHQRPEHVSITGARLNIQWRQLSNVEYLCDGGHTWIHTAVYEGSPVVVKTLKPECQDLATAMHEMEAELDVHSRLSHPHICALVGAGQTRQGVRFLVVERCDGGTIAQRLGYDTRIRDRRRRFWRRQQPLDFGSVVRMGQSLAQAMAYLHESAIPGSVVLHRDLKPDNVGLLLDGTVKLLDFGLAKIMEHVGDDEYAVYNMSGETGSLRYMAPEVADGLPYNAKADVYSFGILLWELVAGKKPFDGLDRALFYERIVHGGERPLIRSKWPPLLAELLRDCWDADMRRRPSFRTIATRLGELGDIEAGDKKKGKQPILPRMGSMIDRHSTWF